MDRSELVQRFRKLRATLIAAGGDGSVRIAQAPGGAGCRA
jgi:hypothetical protein